MLVPFIAKIIISRMKNILNLLTNIFARYLVRASELDQPNKKCASDHIYLHNRQSPCMWGEHIHAKVMLLHTHKIKVKIQHSLDFTSRKRAFHTTPLVSKHFSTKAS
jgi:hypothetical protein